MSSKTQKLTGRRVAITGGARGIGLATAEAFVAQGASVVIGDIDGAQTAQVAAELAEKTGGTVIGLPLDVTDRAVFAKFLDDAESELGGLDVLVNNAGIMPMSDFLDESDAVTDRQIAINLTGVITGSKLAAARFVKQGSGHIVNIASMAGIMANPGVAVYCATKFAVVGLGSSLVQELEPKGVKVSTICPSLVRTELASGVSMGKMLEPFLVVNPEDIANAIVSAVAKGRSGEQIVPPLPGAMVKTSILFPEHLRYAALRLLGAEEKSRPDEAARAAYRARTEKV